jgi:hypothetical protein
MLSQHLQKAKINLKKLEFSRHFYVLPTKCAYVFCMGLRTNSDYFAVHSKLTFITETECVYCAVRTGHLNIIDVFGRL